MIIYVMTFMSKGDCIPTVFGWLSNTKLQHAEMNAGQQQHQTACNQWTIHANCKKGITTVSGGENT